MNEMYPLAALLIHASNQEITKERIVSLLEFLGVEYQMKICEFFEMDALKMKDLLMSSGQGAGPAPAAQASASGSTEVKEEKQEVPEEEMEIDFGFF